MEGDAALQIEGHTLDHPEMPAAIRLEVPELAGCRILAARFGDRLDAEMAAMDEAGPLDLRINALKATRDRPSRRC